MSRENLPKNIFEVNARKKAEALAKINNTAPREPWFADELDPELGTPQEGREFVSESDLIKSMMAADMSGSEMQRALEALDAAGDNSPAGLVYKLRMLQGIPNTEVDRASIAARLANLVEVSDDEG